MHADLLRGFPDLVRDLGGNPEILMQDLALLPSLGPNGVPSLSYRSWVTLLEHAAAELQMLRFRYAPRAPSMRPEGLRTRSVS